MKSIKSITYLILLLLCLCSCEHKDLCYTHPHDAYIKVVFDRQYVSEDEMPKGMRVEFIPTDGIGQKWIFDFKASDGGYIKLPQNEYHVICKNYDTEFIVWKNSDNYWEYTAESAVYNLNETTNFKYTPSLLFTDYIETCDLSNIPEDEERTVLLTPQKRTCRYTYEVIGLRNLDNAAEIYGSLSGLSDKLIIAGDWLPDDCSDTLFFNSDITNQEVIGAFNTFGMSKNEEEPNIFTLYIKNKQGKVYIIKRDVTNQVRSIPQIGHLADVHIKIEVDFEIPIEPGGGTGTGAGFNAEVEDWESEETEIIA